MLAGGSRCRPLCIHMCDRCIFEQIVSEGRDRKLNSAWSPPDTHAFSVTSQHLYPILGVQHLAVNQLAAEQLMSRPRNFSLCRIKLDIARCYLFTSLSLSGAWNEQVSSFRRIPSRVALCMLGHRGVNSGSGRRLGKLDVPTCRKSEGHIQVTDLYAHYTHTSTFGTV
jgi:hypothetical protein